MSLCNPRIENRTTTNIFRTFWRLLCKCHLPTSGSPAQLVQTFLVAGQAETTWHMCTLCQLTNCYCPRMVDLKNTSTVSWCLCMSMDSVIHKIHCQHRSQLTQLLAKSQTHFPSTIQTELYLGVPMQHMLYPTGHIYIHAHAHYTIFSLLGYESNVFPDCSAVICFSFPHYDPFLDHRPQLVLQRSLKRKPWLNREEQVGW